MSADQTVAPFVFVIDTDAYAGNFEREMTAFLTGAVGDCGVGDEEAVLFQSAGMYKPLRDKTQYEPDEHGCCRPTSIWPTPNRWNNGNGKHFNGDPTEKGRYPAYESVAIFFSERPTDEEIAFLKQRAEEYREVLLQADRRYNKKAKKLNIKGFRLISQQIKRDESAV
jgi:hypothetical protein